MTEKPMSAKSLGWMKKRHAVAELTAEVARLENENEVLSRQLDVVMAVLDRLGSTSAFAALKLADERSLTPKEEKAA